MWRVARLAEVRDETSSARTLVLDVPGWPGHLAGQHVDVRLTAADGYRAQRSYSIASAPGGDRVEIRVSTDAPPTIESDALRLGQILTNLVTNALKYSDQKSAVTVEVAPGGRGCIDIAVIDHGIGIDLQERDRVFEPFYRTTEGARAAEGSGLGLAISLRVAAALGGSITAEPTPGGGTTFRLTLPVRAAAR